MAKWIMASEDRIVFSRSLLSRRHLPSQAKVRSTVHRIGSFTQPSAPSGRRTMTSIVGQSVAAVTRSEVEDFLYLEAELLDSAPFGVSEPQRAALLQRTVAARVAISGGRTLTACSFHARPTPRNPATPVKPAFATGIAGWLAEQPGSVVFGMDSDAVVVDHAECRCLAPPHGDHIWATPDLTLAEVGYLHDEAIASGSDHAVVLADFEV